MCKADADVATVPATRSGIKFSPALIIPLCVFATVFFWAAAFPVIKIALRDFPPFELALFRFGLTSAIFAFLALFFKIRLPERSDWGKFALAGFCAVTGYHMALNLGQKTVTAGAASFVVNVVPVLTAIAACIFLGEKFRLPGLIGLFISFSGVALIALGENEGVGLSAGVGFVLLAAVFQTLYFILQKPLLKRYTVFEVVAYSVWAGTLGLSIFLPGLVGRISSASGTGLSAVLFLAIFPGALSFLTWSKLLSLMPASRASSFLYLVPVTATLVAWLWLGEIPKLFSLIGGALALAGVVVVNRNLFRR